MENEKKVNMSEGVPLNTTGAANIFLNTGFSKTKSSNGTVIHLNTDKSSHPDVGVHIDTTFAIASSKKKKKLLIILTFLPSVICIIISCSIAWYYWNEMVSMRRQLDSIRLIVEENSSHNKIFTQTERPHQEYLHNIGLNLQTDMPQQDPLIIFKKPSLADTRESRMGKNNQYLSNNVRKFYVEGLGQDMLLVDISKKPIDVTQNIQNEVSNSQLIPKQAVLVAHFNGAMNEINLGDKDVVGPWSRDTEVSTEGSENKFQLSDDRVTISEGGLYLVYAQLTYITHAPNCFLIWATQEDKVPRLLTSCATGDDSSNRPLAKSHISCSVQVVTRLYKGDKISLAPRESNRTVCLKPGKSYLGFVKISS